MAATSTTRWERTEGSAFSGLSRGRGSRGRGGHRGGRASGRTNPPQTMEDNSHTSKPPQRPSRGDPPPLQAPGTQAQAILSNRRRRLQVSKNSANDPKPSPAASTDSQHLVVPTSAITREPPPHLKRHDVRHDIEALVERVRAVAMDNRPATPGSHIDWAGDDDDTLPDLDDWGVSTSKFAPGESESISPIILEGLKPLPVISAPATPGPKQAASLDNPATSDIEVNLIMNQSQESTSTASKSDEEQVVSNAVASKNLDTVSQLKAESPEQPFSPRHVNASYPSNQTPWHPSLPARPPAGSPVPRVNLRPVATPMRHPVYTKSITKESSLLKEAQGTLEQVEVESTSVTSPMSVEVVSAIVKLADESVLETSNTEARAISATSDSRPDPTDLPHQRDLFDDDGSEADGLEASIHAPKSPAPSGSIIPTTASRNHSPYKKEPNNRHSTLSRNANGDPVNRLPWNGRSRLQSGVSFRNQSSSKVAPNPHHHRIHSTRPIITGDAMSRLARTIGQTNSAT